MNKKVMINFCKSMNIPLKTYQAMLKRRLKIKREQRELQRMWEVSSR